MKTEQPTLLRCVLAVAGMISLVIGLAVLSLGLMTVSSENCRAEVEKWHASLGHDVVEIEESEVRFGNLKFGRGSERVFRVVVRFENGRRLTCWHKLTPGGHVKDWRENPRWELATN